jgi:hypothetical protein
MKDSQTNPDKEISKEGRLKNIKKDIDKSYNHFKDNYKSFHDFRRFAFVSTLEESDLNFLRALKKPEIESNIIEAYISRLLGEFAKQEPSIEVRSEALTKPDPLMIDVVEGHFRHLLSDTGKDGHAYEVYRDLLSGGFSVFKVFTEYANEKSFDHVIKLQRVSDPTMCGFDPAAKLKGKTDSRYCFERFVLTKEEAKKYNIDPKKFGVGRSDDLGGLQWEYSSGDDERIMVVDYYEKVIEKGELLQLSDDSIVSRETYNEMKRNIKNILNADYPGEDFKDLTSEHIPSIKKSRETDIVKIYRTRLTGSEIIERVETDYKSLPLIFVDGNSITYRESGTGKYKQVTRPLIFHAKGMQRLKNTAMQTLAYELENMVQHKWKVANGSVPPGQEEVYRNVQAASVLVYEPYKNNDLNFPLPPPMEVSRIPIPQEVMNTFMVAETTIQNILGSYDASMGINNNQLSGVALREAASHSNATAMPYIEGYLHGLSDAAQVILELIPLYYTTSRTIPVMLNNSKRDFIRINDHELGNISLSFDPSTLKVMIKAGLNFDAQKANTIQSIVQLSSSMPALSDFFNAKALPILIDNLSEMRGGDKLIGLVEDYMAEKKKAAEQNNTPDPVTAQIELEQEHLRLKEQEIKSNTAIKAAGLEIDSYGKETDRMKLALTEQQTSHSHMVELDKHHSEKARIMAELAIKSADLVHRHGKDNKNNEEFIYG